MSVYEELGVRPVINAAATLTRLGGSRLDPRVSAAMAEAGRSFVDMAALQRVVSREIADTIGVPAAHVSAGAASGIVLSLWACMTRADLPTIGRFMVDPGAWHRRRIVAFGGQRNPYDRLLQSAQARVVHVGDAWQTFEWELEGALEDEAAAVLFFAGSQLALGTPDLRTVVRIAHAHAVPVIVDAAAQALPRENLRRFIDEGADLAIFSGGKAIRGPQSTGLIVGRTDLIDAVIEHAAPNQRLGRAMKVGKEELVGLLVAFRAFMLRDEAAERQRWEESVGLWLAAFADLPGTTAEREFPGEAGLPIPRVRLTLGAGLGLDAAGLEQALLLGEPAIAVIRRGDALLLAPDGLEGDEAAVVAACVADRLREAAGGRDGGA